MKTAVYTLHTVVEKRIVLLVWGFAVAFIAFLSLYSYFVKITVFHIVERSSYEQKIGAITSEIGELEFTYGSLKSKITLDTAEELGLSASEDITFVSRAPHTSGLTIRDVRR